MKRALWCAALVLGLAIPHAASAQLLDGGYGPDGWRVVDVAPGDGLNVRMGPGTAYPVVASLPHNAGGIQQETCVPLTTIEQFSAMTAAQYAALPPRWCLIHNADRSVRGWVNAAYLGEEGVDELAQAPVTAPDVDFAATDPVPMAEALVRQLYAAHAAATRGGGQSPLHMPAARAYFFDGVAERMDPARVGADPLYDAQDFDISNLRIAADPDQPMFRGMITIHADFLNFGEPRRVTFSLRPDTQRPDAPLRIFRVEYEEWEIE